MRKSSALDNYFDSALKSGTISLSHLLTNDLAWKITLSCPEQLFSQGNIQCNADDKEKFQVAREMLNVSEQFFSQPILQLVQFVAIRLNTMRFFAIKDKYYMTFAKQVTQYMLHAVAGLATGCAK